MSTTTTEQTTLGVKEATKPAPIVLTEKAAAEVKRIVAEQSSPEKLYLRVRGVGRRAAGQPGADRRPERGLRHPPRPVPPGRVPARAPRRADRPTGEEPRPGVPDGDARPAGADRRGESRRPRIGRDRGRPDRPAGRRGHTGRRALRTGGGVAGGQPGPGGGVGEGPAPVERGEDDS